MAAVVSAVNEVAVAVVVAASLAVEVLVEAALAVVSNSYFFFLRFFFWLEKRSPRPLKSFFMIRPRP